MDYKKLGKRIKEERLKKNLTQERLAESINLTGVYISHIENASTKPSLETVVNLSNALNVTPDFLLFDSLYKSKEYLNDEIAKLLKQCSNDELKLVVRLIEAVINNK